MADFVIVIDGGLDPELVGTSHALEFGLKRVFVPTVLFVEMLVTGRVMEAIQLLDMCCGKRGSADGHE